VTALVRFGKSNLENVGLSSFDSLITTLQKNWSALKYIAFVVVFEDDKLIESDDDFRFFGGHSSISLKIKSFCIGFSKYTKNKGRLALQMVGAKFTEQDFIPESDEAFPIYDGDVQMLDSQVQIVQQELIRRIQKIPLEKASEYSKRELISPLLLGALFLVNGVSMGCEKRVVGHYGRGPIDYVFIFRSVLILLTEAKLNDLDAGFIQNIMQQQSSRDFLTSVLVDADGPPVFAELRKRKFEEISNKLSSFASFGVVTTASSWLFTKVERDPDDGKAVITRSKRVELRLTDPQTPEENKTQQMDIARIIGKLVAIIKLQMKAVEDNALITGGPNIELVQGIISGAVPVTGEYESDEDDECE